MKAQYFFIILFMFLACSKESQKEENVKINKINYLAQEVSDSSDGPDTLTINGCNFSTLNVSSLFIAQINYSEQILGGYCRNPDSHYASDIVSYSVNVIEHIGGDELDENINIVDFRSFALSKYDLQEGDIVLVAIRESRGEIFSWSAIKLNVNSSEEQREYPKVIIDLPDTPEELTTMYNETRNNLEEYCPQAVNISDEEWEQNVFEDCH
jgi:hypothetical protein